jgi:dTDP-glucose pyrophosphorylase
LFPQETEPSMNDVSDLHAGLVIADTSTIRSAMQAIQTNGREVVLVRDARGRIAGVITDGDLRRGLLSGLALDDAAAKVMTCDFVSTSPAADRASVLDLMKARSLQHVPVLDKDRRLVAIHFMRELIGGTPKPNIAVIMAGGKGSRLKPFTEQVPKPMVEVAGRPMLERIVLHLVGHGVNTIYLAVNFMAELIEKHFGDGSGLGCRISYLRENKPLGTGGALSLLPAPPEHPFFVLNGDLITRVDVTAMLEAHVRGKHAATIGVGPYQVQIPFGTAVVEAGRLVALEEKPSISFVVNRGIYVLEPATLKFVPKDREFPITELFDELLAAKKSVGVFNFEDSWLDIGIPEDLRRAHGHH